MCTTCIALRSPMPNEKIPLIERQRSNKGDKIDKIDRSSNKSCLSIFKIFPVVKRSKVGASIKKTSSLNSFSCKKTKKASLSCELLVYSLEHLMATKIMKARD